MGVGGGIGGVAQCVHGEKNKYQEVVGENEEGGWMDGWMVQVRQVHKWKGERERRGRCVCVWGGGSERSR